MRGLVAASAVCFFTVIGLVGCVQQTTEERPVIEERSSYDLVIGAESAEVVNLSIGNGTGLSIVGLQFKLTDSVEYSANVMTAEQIWEAGQMADVFFEGAAIEEEGIVPEDSEAQYKAAAEASEAREDLLLSEIYDVQLTAVDGTVFALHRLSLTGLMGAENIAINYDAATGYGYLTYLEDGIEVGTLESEQHMAAAAAAIAQAESGTNAAA